MISLTRYRALLREPHVGSALAASIIGRLPIGMAVLSLLLFVQQATGSFARAGAAAALYVAGIGVLAPFVGRLVDRFGPRPVLRISAAAYPVALAWLVTAVIRDAGALEIGIAAAVAGATLPPISSCARALLRQLLHDDAHLQAAYSLDSVIVESVFIVGPAVVTLLAATGYPSAGVLGAALFGAIGSIAFMRAPAVRAWRIAPPARRTLLGPLTAPGLVPVLLVTLCYSTGFGLFEVAVTAVAARANVPAAAGLILAVASVGSAAGVLLYGSRSWPLGMLGQYRIALAAMAVGLALLVPTGDLWVFAAVSILTGAPMSVVLAAQSMLIARIAPAATLAESFTWSATCLLSGVSGGIALGGFMLEQSPPERVLVLAALVTLVALLLAATTVRARHLHARA